jgi:hypothetical protein
MKAVSRIHHFRTNQHFHVSNYPNIQISVILSSQLETEPDAWKACLRRHFALGFRLPLPIKGPIEPGRKKQVTVDGFTSQFT